MAWTVSKTVRFEASHVLPAHDGKCARLHGHSWQMTVSVKGNVLINSGPKAGMVMDFGDLKRAIGQWIDDTIDHTMLLHQDDPMVPVLTAQGERFQTLEVNPTAENIAKLIYDHAVAGGFPVAEVTLWETENSFATYCGPVT